MSEKSQRAQCGEDEQQALLRHTIDLNTEMIAQANRLISASRSTRGETADNDRGD